MNEDSSVGNVSRSKWRLLRNELLKRPLLVPKIGMSLEQFESYMNGKLPTVKQVEQYDKVLYNDKVEKCRRIREELSKIVGHRESVLYAEKIHVSSTIVRNLLDAKGPIPGYDTLIKFEVYLNRVTGFPISIENLHLAEKVIPDRIENIATTIFEVCDALRMVGTYVYKVKSMAENEKQRPVSSRDLQGFSSYEDILKYQHEKLAKVHEELKIIKEIYLTDKI